MLVFSSEVSSLSIPFVIVEYRNDTPIVTHFTPTTNQTETTNNLTSIPTEPTTSSTTQSTRLPPLRVALPFWHSDALKAVTLGSSLEHTADLVAYSELLDMLLAKHYPVDSNSTLPIRYPLIVDIGSCLGELITRFRYLVVHNNNLVTCVGHLPLVAATKGLQSIVYQPVVVNAEKVYTMIGKTTSYP